MDLNFHCYTSGKRTREPLLLEGQGWRNWRARALTKHSKLNAKDLAMEAMRIASEICIYTNANFTVEEI